MQEINISKIDASELAALESIIKEISKGTTIPKELLLKINSAKGEIEIALKMAEALHKSDIAIRTLGDGELDTAATIALAAGEPGFRLGKPGLKSRCTDGDPYMKGSKLDDLDSKDQAVYDALSELTGNPKRILEKILSAEEISSTAAIKCGIIDEIDGFKSKYKNKIEHKKGTSNSNIEKMNDSKDENLSEENSNSDISQQTAKRGRRIKN